MSKKRIYPLLLIAAFITAIYAQDPPLEFNYIQSTLEAFYYFEMAVIDDLELTNEDWVGAFSGDICVGARQWNGPYTDIPVGGDDGFFDTEGYMNVGEIPSFQIYDVSTDTFLPAFSSEEVGWEPLMQVIIPTLSAENIWGCSDPDAFNYDPAVTQDDGSCLYLVLGDVTLDETVDILDLVAMVFIILGFDEPIEQQLLAGDFNQDGSMDILDVVATVFFILGI